MPDDETLFDLPFDPLAVMAAIDQLDALAAGLESTHGPVERWPAEMMGRYTRRSTRIHIMVQANEAALYRARGRFGPISPHDFDQDA